MHYKYHIHDYSDNRLGELRYETSFTHIYDDISPKVQLYVVMGLQLYSYTDRY